MTLLNLIASFVFNLVPALVFSSNVIQHSQTKQPVEKRVHMTYTSQSQYITERSQGRNSRLEPGGPR